MKVNTYFWPVELICRYVYLSIVFNRTLYTTINYFHFRRVKGNRSHRIFSEKIFAPHFVGILLDCAGNSVDANAKIIQVLQIEVIRAYGTMHSEAYVIKRYKHCSLWIWNSIHLLNTYQYHGRTNIIEKNAFFSSLDSLLKMHLTVTFSFLLQVQPALDQFSNGSLYMQHFFWIFLDIYWARVPTMWYTCDGEFVNGIFQS